MESKNYLPLCLYYHGEQRNPYKATELKYTFWELEQVWITQVLNSMLNDEYVSKFMYDFPDLLDNVTTKAPTSLKAFMYDRYLNCGADKKGFEVWLLNYTLEAL